MTIELNYGRNGLSLDLPTSIQVSVIEKPPMPVISDPAAKLIRDLNDPGDESSLAAIAKGKSSACILICDITRPVPNGQLLAPVLETLAAAGVPISNTTILIATGLHRPNEGEELREVIGDDDIVSRYRVANHFARDREAHVDLGTTGNGVPMVIDRRFVEAEVRIVIGLVEPHFMAGYSGGRKLVAPGVAYQDTILTFHTANFLENPAAANCQLAGNPLHQAQLEIIRRIGDITAVNVVLDDRRRVAFVNAGPIESAHAEAVAFVEPYAVIPVARRFHTIVTTGAGYPLDNTYYQAIKGMVSVIDILEPGGTIILAAACEGGLGSDEFSNAQARYCQMGRRAFVDSLIPKQHALVDEWQTEMLAKAHRLGHIQLYTQGLTPDLLTLTGVESVESVASAVAASVQTHNDSHIAVIPEGPYLIPRYRA